MEALLPPDAADEPPEPCGEAFAAVDAQGLVMSWSAGAQRLLGYTAREVQGRSAAGLLCPGTDADRLLLRTRTGPGLLGPARLRSRDGDQVAAVLWLHPLAPTGGGPRWLLQAAEETAVRAAELRLALLRGLFTESPLIIDVFDSRLRLMAQNSSQTRLPGAAGPGHTGRTLRETAPPGLMDVAAMEALEARQRRVLSTGRALIGTHVRGRDPQDPSRQAVWSETILPLRSDRGRTVGLAHMVADVTAEARARERLAMVSDASACIGSRLDVRHTAQELTDFAVPRFADCAYVNLLDPVSGGTGPDPGPASPLRRAAVSTTVRRPGMTTVTVGQVDSLASRPGSPAARALADRRPLLLSGDDLYGEHPATEEWGATLRRNGVHSVLLVPLYARGTALGTAVFARCHPTRLFEADDVLLAGEFVARAAACIDNAARYTRERTTAQSLQRSLLPRRLPGLATVDAAARHLPARGTTLLGGAWFDVIPLAGARVAFAAGDTGGRGLQAAASMGRVRTAVRTMADLDLAPEELLSHLAHLVKRAALHRGDRPTRSTCVYAVFDPLARRCTLASAGHPMPALVGAGGGVQFPCLAPGPALDVHGAPYESCEMTVSDGDRLVLCTAGLLSAGGADTGADGLEPAMARLGEALSRCGSFTRRPAGGRRPDRDPGQEVEEDCEALLRRLHAPDRTGDAALLVARLRGLRKDHHATWTVAAEPEAVGRVRSLVGRKLCEWHLEEREFTTQLLVSELVTNAVRYGEPPISLRLIRDRNLICEVSDGSSTSPLVRRALETDEGGRGLYMVTQLADLWGTRYHDRGKSVWAEQPLLPMPP
ncbi:SpoIIE family protein phosphatase [Streptacidiphilus griseoplanus]|uniref:SpoIIE family protein phosphatase n=1 Tax=Peterkaempfera griseoplana TaxID=66896 RepID=UPI0006E4459F|nr:SpoIIE family protein phosphatase [Peterkaempfera griseoplana]